MIARKCLQLRQLNKCNFALVYTNKVYLKNVSSRIQKNHDIGLRCIHSTSILNKIVPFKLSDIGEGIKEVVVKEWFVKEGDKVQQFDNICEVQSDKATVTITSRYDGTVTRLYHQVDQTALVGHPLVDINVEDSGEEESPSPKDEKIETNADAKTESIAQRTKVLTTPAVRRIAAQFKVDLSTVNATGKNGRLLKEDLLSHLNMSSDNSNIVPEPSQIKAATVETVAEDKTVPITGFTKAMVKSMTEAMKIPHFGYCDEYDVTKLVESRENLKVLAQKQGVKLTYMPIIVKAASQSLTAYPILNSSLDSACENITYKSSHNIGVAMDTPNGLVVPVIKNVQNKSIIEIAKELNSLQDKGSKGQLSLSDLSGGTFTISNIGIVGGTYTKPIIFPPQVSIGALGKIQVLPRFDAAGNLVKAHILTVSWSADHRVVDGVTMARFSNQLKAYLENPYKMLLDL
ncbi:lipoamide acyltransferase component of branched-chain alpha-keto acid dehydrogenase complex, mitochondrial [Aricia agestis]|uniref:lipoamide acyltransferase component of branched-chain alpha-keto acid dehydrogenase complex, mitochondrial n=1 Tax=Aricia agestis TaxID=91739 RepID=UPI001C20543F|nr:lipoamide acyltransferase component of branched-chain alpha-keto acid dehydrogenase complex, mitochondrial [Aricia agestis]